MKTCPFCGSCDLGIGAGTKDREGTPYYIYCDVCGARGPSTYLNDVCFVGDALGNLTMMCHRTGWNERHEKD